MLSMPQQPTTRSMVKGSILQSFFKWTTTTLDTPGPFHTYHQVYGEGFIPPAIS